MKIRLAQQVQDKKKPLSPVLCCAIVFSILLEPAWFNEFPLVDALFIIGKVCCLFIVLFCWFRAKEIPKLFALIMIFELLQLLSTMMHGGDCFSAVKATVNVACFVAVTEWIFKSRGADSFKALLFVFEVLIICNLISVIAAPSGLYRLERESGWWSNACWFLGLRNGMAPQYVIAAFLEYANVLREKWKPSSIIRCVAFIVFATTSIILINQSTTAITSTSSAGGLVLIWAIVLACPLFGLVSFLRKKMTFKTAVIVSSIISWLLVVVRIQNYFSFIIVDVLGKDLTLSNRTTIWDAAIGSLNDHIVFGHGVEAETVMSARLNNWAAVTTTHNGWLDVVYFGGLVALCILAVVLLYVSNMVERSGLSIASSYLIGYMSFAYFATGLTEALVSPRFFFFLAIIVGVANKSILSPMISSDEKAS